MNKQNILFGIIGLIVGSVIGFFAANSINRNSSQIVSPAQPNASFQDQEVPNVLVKEQPAQGGMLPDITAILDKARNAPDNFDAQIKGGDVYLQIKGFDKAVEFYQRAHRIKPEDYETIVKLGNAYFDFGKFEEAGKWYEQALSKKSNDTSVRTDLGITFVERENPDLDRAIKEFQTSLQTSPKHEPTLYNLGVAYFKKGNTDEANKILAQLKAINPQSQLVGRLQQIIK
ncbi:MAG: tetratricopeptide repeat protein [Acidobacteriota bacterium]|nr:tetratricopeptide repeat protein [Acidobacteriota bacterium]